MYRHMVEFEESRIPKTLSQFQNCDKEGLVRGLWRDYQNNPRILRLVSLIMLDYGIYDSGLWTELLLQLASMKMYRFLLTLLDRIPIEVTQTIAVRTHPIPAPNRVLCHVNDNLSILLLSIYSRVYRMFGLPF